MCMAGGCDDTAFATVFPVDPGACSSIEIGLTCGGGGLCGAATAVEVNFAKPAPAGVAVDVDRGLQADVEKSPVTTLGTSIANNVEAATPVGNSVSISDAAPTGDLLFYLASCHVAGGGPKASGTQNLAGAASARFQNP